MKDKKEFIELKNVSDYWKKFLWDYNNLKNDHNNVYVAFNFIVTAWHLTDWYIRALSPTDKYSQISEKIKMFVSDNRIVEISEHLANGAKHFEITFNKHKSVRKTIKERYAQEGYWVEGYTEDPIIIYFNDDFDSEFGESVKLEDYSKKLVDFWNDQLKSNGFI